MTRVFATVLLLFLCSSSAGPACIVSDFKFITLSTHDPNVREKVALIWLKEVGPFCSLEKIIIIRNNRANWMGTADTLEINILVETLLERKR